ncbi:hypothetical protein K438DRAFT_2006816 [Mycena galopus ATCC 62051]|nr:hypothetical protein K438DRAFT_2006816 [Mycena galopus ATCC 62051]
MVESAAVRDIIEGKYVIPNLYNNIAYCVSYTIHARSTSLRLSQFTQISGIQLFVTVCSHEGRTNRASSPRIRWKDEKKIYPAVAVAEEDAKFPAAAANKA